MANQAIGDSLYIQIRSSASEASVGIRSLRDALASLKATAKGGAGLTATVNQIDKLNQALGRLDSSKLGAQAASLEKAIAPLNEKINELATSVSNLSTVTKKVSRANYQLTATSGDAAKKTSYFGSSMFAAFSKASIYIAVLSSVHRALSKTISAITEYVETVNLFQVSMGEFYDEAYDYAMLVNDKLGIDPSEWMRNQGVFMSMGNGFGLAAEDAYALSKGLTELSYDISSLYNEDITTAAQRLQSALAGEIEPIRRLGISISQATLQEYALEKGITESVSAMTEQEKALLRSLKLIEGAADIGAIGDFARTLESPANALRILRQQVTELKRAIGSVLIPVLVQIIPYLQAVVSLATDAISALATIVGFAMPKWDSNDWSNALAEGASSAEESFSGAAGAAKDLKNAVMGFDELNIISPQTQGGGGAGVGADTSSWVNDLEIPDLWDSEFIANIETKFGKIKEDITGFINVIKANIDTDKVKELADAWAHLKNQIRLLANNEDFQKIVDFIGIIVASGINNLLGKLSSTIEFISKTLENLRELLNGDLLAWFDILKDSVAFLGMRLFNTLFRPVLSFIDTVFGTETVKKVDELYRKILEFDFSQWLNGLIQDVKTFFHNAKEKVDGAIDYLKEIGASILLDGETFISKIEGFVDLFRNAFETATDDGYGFFDLMWAGIKKGAVTAMNGIISAVEKMLNNIVSGINNRIGFLNSLISTAGEILEKDWGGISVLQTITLPRIPMYATGGFPEDGLFAANSSEIVGRFSNGRTAVANNYQIVDGIANGVYSAVSAAMSNAGGGGSYSFAIYLDGKQIKAAVKKVEKEQGARIATGGLIYG